MLSLINNGLTNNVIPELNNTINFVYISLMIKIYLKGFEGDGYTCNETITCHDHPDICHQDATCAFSFSTHAYNCECNVGFFGNGSHCKGKNIKLIFQ